MQYKLAQVLSSNLISECFTEEKSSGKITAENTKLALRDKNAIKITVLLSQLRNN